MKEIIKTTEYKVYEYSEEEKKEIIKRVLEENKYKLSFYWDYRDSLSEEDIIKIIKEEDGLNSVLEDLYRLNDFYIYESIEEIINQNLTEEEKTDEELKELLKDELLSNYDLNIKDLLRNSSIRLRLELNTNYDFIDLNNKRDETLKEFRKVFKGCYDSKELIKEINNFIGSQYAKITFFFKLSGENILNFRDEYQKGFLTLKKGLSFGLFNSWLGCGSVLEMKLRKDIKISLKDWSNKGLKYFDVSLIEDKKKYGINETYGLLNSCWKEF